MVKHITRDCNFFEKSPTVEKILKEVNIYQNRIDELRKALTSCVESDINDYRRASFDLNQQALEIKNEILRSDMCLLYSKLYIIHHLEDMSIYNEEIGK